jgi:hypothetical protein
VERSKVVNSLLMCIRCLSILKQISMAAFTARPSMRITLCEERILLCVEILDRASLVFTNTSELASRPLPSSASGRLFTFADLITHDLTQLQNFIAGRADRQALRGQWLQTLERCRHKILERIPHWYSEEQATVYDGEWTAAAKLLNEIASAEPLDGDYPGLDRAVAACQDAPSSKSEGAGAWTRSTSIGLPSVLASVSRCLGGHFR